LSEPGLIDFTDFSENKNQGNPLIKKISGSDKKAIANLNNL
jgi:hypothetical protein